MKKVSSPTPHTLTPLHPSFKPGGQIIKDLQQIAAFVRYKTSVSKPDIRLVLLLNSDS
jgi:hypothetical protein